MGPNQGQACTQCGLSLREQRRLTRDKKGDTIDRQEKALGCIVDNSCHGTRGNEQAKSPGSVSPVSLSVLPRLWTNSRVAPLLAQKRPKIQRSKPSHSTQEQLKGCEMVKSSWELVNSPGRRHLDWEGRQPRPRQESVGSDLHTG